jgi:hypothetical protein
MPKKHRVEIRLSDENYQTLQDRVAQYDDTITGVIERLLHTSVPVGICGVRQVGNEGRRRFSVRFSSGMIVHGFLWSQGGQLLGPRIRVPRPDGGWRWFRIVDGSSAFWHQLRELCEEELEGGVEEPTVASVVGQGGEEGTGE